MNTAKVLQFPHRSATTNFSKICFDKCKVALSEVIDNVIKYGGHMDFEKLSNQVFESGKKITATIIQSVIEDRANSEGSISSHPCPSCNGLGKGKGTKKRTIETRHGKISFTRPYYYCQPCKSGFFPLDDELKLAAEAKQYDLGKLALDFLISMPYAEASKLFKKSTGETFSDHCMHGLACSIGDEAILDLVLPTKDQIALKIEECTTSERKPIMVISADGAHEPLRPNTGKRDGKRGSGYWKEAKGFRVYLSYKDRIEQVGSWHQICNEAEFGEALKFMADLIPHDKVRIALVGDGAPWIWKHMTSAFPNGREILDYFHLSEHIHKVAQVQFENDPEKALGWSESTLSRLNYGEVESVIWGLDRINSSSKEAKEEMRKLKTYLTNNIDRINYRHNRYGSYPSGSGGIESANKYICHIRLKRSGAWWYEENANRILRIHR